VVTNAADKGLGPPSGRDCRKQYPLSIACIYSELVKLLIIVDLWKQQIEVGSVYFRDCLLLEDGHFRVLRRKTVRYFVLVTIMYAERLLDCPAESYIYEKVFTFVGFTIKSLLMHSRFNKFVYCSVSWF
jgi:hypothetical protein